MSIRIVLRQVGIVLSVTVMVVCSGGSGDGGNSKATSGDKSALVGRWDLVKGPTRDNPEAIELLSDETGIVDGGEITYKTESGRLYLTATAGSGRAGAYDYKVSGPRLTLTNDGGDVLKYLKKGHTLSESEINVFLYGENRISKWTKQNINIKTPDSWCYGDDESNCAKYGRLYTWEAAKKVCASMGSKWRLPTREDWDNLVYYAGGDVAGKKLKSKTGWNSNDNGTDEFGFSALPGGFRYTDGSFLNSGNLGYWWSASESGGGRAYYRYMFYDFDNVDESASDVQYGISTRCVED